MRPRGPMRRCVAEAGSHESPVAWRPGRLGALRRCTPAGHRCPRRHVGSASSGVAMTRGVCEEVAVWWLHTSSLP